jgi:hypothetical protein
LDDTMKGTGVFSSQQKNSCAFEEEDGKKSRKTEEPETRNEVIRAKIMVENKGKKQ